MTNSKSMRRLLAVLLAVLTALSLSAPAFAAVTSFSDVPASHNFHDAILWCANQSIVGGYNDGTFQPSKTVTRSNFSVMLSRAFYASEVATNQTQPIYTEKGTFYPNFMALYLNGIYSGTDMAGKAALQSADTMNTGINRYEMAQLMTNIMKQKGFAASDSEKNAAISKIADYSAIPSQFQDAVANVYALGIIGGYSDGSFSGSGIMNRGQACVVIYRMMQYSGNTSSGSVTTPVPEVPAEPVTTTAGTGTLADGTEATEANVMRLLEEAYQAKAGQEWGATGANDGYPQGNSSALYNTITLGTRKSPNGIGVSVQGGCGGFAAYLSDYVFGQKAAVRETTLDKMRAGDVILLLNNNAIGHIVVYCGHTGTGVDIYGNATPAYNNYTAVAGGIPGHTTGSSGYSFNDGIYKANSTTGQSYVIYTRYPDSSSGNTSSGSVATPAPEAPAEPVAVTTGKLSDGSEATEANVMRLLEEAYQAKAGTAWGTPSTSTGQSTSAVYPGGNGSALYAVITNGQYKDSKGGNTSVVSGCGGFAAYLSDYVFGQKTAVRKTTLDKMRAGDVILHLVDNQITHVNIYDGTTGTGTDVYGKPATEYGTYDANAGDNPGHTPNTSWHPNDGITTDYKGRTISYAIYTRYPD